MNSDKQFYFAFSNANYNEMQPYETYLNCARSTEKMILNDNYAEYIKNGYNYDLWNQKRTEKLATINAVVSGISAATSLAGTAVNFGFGLSAGIQGVKTAKKAFSGASLALSVAQDIWESSWDEDTEEVFEPAKQFWDETRKNYDAAKQGLRNAKIDVGKSFTGIGSLVLNQGINAVNSIVNSAASIESSRRNFANSVSARANTPVSASGNVPTDLFDNYSSNKLKRFEYTLRDDERKNLFNTFRLTGYAHPVQEIPVFNSRIYSNFVQCKPVFLNSLTEIYKVYLDDISARFQAGVTVKHNYNGKYDLYDQYENYETIVMGD